MSAATNRGLGPILPTADTSEKDELSDDQRLLHSLVDAGLDQISTIGALDLLAYLHLPRFDEPVLFLRQPSLGTLSATRAFRLMNRFAHAANSSSDEGTFTEEGVVTAYLRCSGTRSTGVHFFGRSAAVIEAPVIAELRATTRTFATITNQYVAGTPTDLDVPGLVVEINEQRTTVHATAPGRGMDSVGRAESTNPQEAVVRAVLAATGSKFSFRDAREVPLEDERAVLVVLADEFDELHPGFVISSDDLLQSTATATMRAVADR